MPELIKRFNQAYAEGNNPETGQKLAQGETPVYVWGTDPVSGSWGTVAQGVVNAVIAPNNANVYKPSQLETVENQVASHIKSLRAGGGTELFQATTEAIDIMNQEDDSERVRAVIVLSDGADTGDSGVRLTDALTTISASRDSLNPVIIVPLVYGADADIQTLNSIAQASKTRVQSGDTNSITSVLELLSSDQSRHRYGALYPDKIVGAQRDNVVA
ncbi:MAG: hypothetical protein K8I30_13290, partial [Anaerolineae bacterium]|nr:hypothetical protein [Anaerolineae bacterium]